MRFTRNALPGIIMSLTTRWHHYEQPSKSEYGSRAADGIFFLSPHYIAHFAGSNNGVIRTRWNPQQFTAVTLGHMCSKDFAQQEFVEQPARLRRAGVKSLGHVCFFS
jgi:hypothetical protein